MKFLNQGFDHIEFVVNDVQAHADKWKKIGFEEIGTATNTVLLGQGLIRLLIKKPDSKSDALGTDFLNAHGDGISVLAVEVEDAKEAYEITTSRGARSAAKPEVFESQDGAVCVAEIYTPCDLRYRFIQRKSKGKNCPALFLKDLTASRLQSPSPGGIIMIDHLTNNINIGDFETWTTYYREIFNFKTTRTFKIKTGRTGLLSDVVESQCGKIKVPINEATEPESQVQEFCDRFKGPGVQHLAFLVQDIITNLRGYREQGYKFLNVPSTYYEEVPTRVPGVTEDLKVLEELGILLDGEGGGYLMQIFSEELIGPFFVEFIQRKGNKGFGEGNFKALFESMERDQIRRGVLEVEPAQ